MSRRRDALMVAVALIAGLVGGVVSSWVFMTRLMGVQQPILPTKVIQAERFEVVGKEGKIRAVLGEATLEFLMKHFDLLYARPDLPEEEKKKALEANPLSVGLFLVDEEEKIRTALTIDASGLPYLNLVGDNPQAPSCSLSSFHIGLSTPQEGSIELLAGSKGYGPIITLNGPEGRAAYLDVGASHGPVLEFSRAPIDGMGGSASLGVRREGPSLDLRGREGGIASLDVFPLSPTQKTFLHVKPGMETDRPSLSLYGPAAGEESPEQASAGLSVDVDRPHLDLDSRQNSAARLEVDADGPSLQLLDTPLRTRAALGSIQLKDSRTGSVETRSPSSLVLFGENGKTIWQAP